MATVLDTVRRIARQCSVEEPSSWITATSKEHVEIRDDFLHECIEDIQDRVDCPSPIGKQTTITGDGTTAYALPADFRRLQRDRLAVYDDYLNRPVDPITTDGQWAYIVDQGMSGVGRFYQLTGYEGAWTLNLFGAPPVAVTVTVSYVSSVWCASSAGAEQSAWMAEEDLLLLPRRLVEAGTVWRFRERSGLPYADKFNEAELLLQQFANDVRGRRVLDFGGPGKAVRWQDIIPAVIPAS